MAGRLITLSRCSLFHNAMIFTVLRRAHSMSHVHKNWLPNVLNKTADCYACSKKKQAGCSCPTECPKKEDGLITYPLHQMMLGREIYYV